MTEMIDRVAEALAKVSATAQTQVAFSDYARAAIQAMRTPTQDMLLAGRHYPETRREWGIWQAMIDAALVQTNDKGPPPR